MVLGPSQLLQLAVTGFLLADAVNAKRPTEFNKKGKGILCERDLLLIVDTSYSVGKANFDQQVKPFLEDLVSDADLNVAPDGTQVSLILFSDHSDPSSPNYRPRNDRTKVMIPFSSKYDGQTLKEYIKSLRWEDVRGGRTRTDVALEIANTQIFSSKSPLNNRRTSRDLIVLITDGKPHGIRGCARRAIAEAEKLKKKGVSIIGIGVGEKIRNPRFWNILKIIASPGQVIRAEFDKLQSVRKALERKTCERAGLRCNCPQIRSAPYYLRPNQKKAKVWWVAPTPYCAGVDNNEIVNTEIEPPLKAPHHFEVGEYNIDYKFFFNGGLDVNCSVKFEVKVCSCPPSNLEPVRAKPGEPKAEVQWSVPVPDCLGYKMPVVHKFLSIGKHSIEYNYKIKRNFNMVCEVNVEVKGALCSERAFNSDNQICCYGEIHDKKPNFECCGQHYFDTSKKKCCTGFNIRDKKDICPRQ